MIISNIPTFIRASRRSRTPGISCVSAYGREPPSALLAEAADNVAGVAAGELHRVFAQAAQAFGEVSHGYGLVAVFLGGAAEEVAAEAFECLLQLLVTGEVQRAEVVDERGEEFISTVACTRDSIRAKAWSTSRGMSRL